MLTFGLAAKNLSSLSLSNATTSGDSFAAVASRKIIEPARKEMKS